MKILIAYAGKTGTTQKCAELLAQSLPEAVVINLEKEEPEPLDQYDGIVIGGSIRMGRLNRQVGKFIDSHYEELMLMRIAFFICCGMPQASSKYFSENFSAAMLNHAVEYQCFGGELALEKVHGWERMVVKMALKAIEKDPDMKMGILVDNIEKIQIAMS